MITAAARSQLEQLFSEVSGDGVGDMFISPSPGADPGLAGGHPGGAGAGAGQGGGQGLVL